MYYIGSGFSKTAAEKKKKEPGLFDPFYDQSDVDNEGNVHASREQTDRFRRHAAIGAGVGGAMVALPLASRLIRKRPMFDEGLSEKLYALSGAGIGALGLHDATRTHDETNETFTKKRNRGRMLAYPFFGKKKDKD